MIFVFLCIFGILGNYLNLSLFFGVSFIFGSIAVLVAIRLLGVTSGVIVALIAGAYTYIIWGHLYAMIIFSVEALFVGIVMRHKTSSLIIADIFYWVFIGMPLVWILYTYAIGMSETQTTLILLKQPVNGIVNAIIATYILFLLPEKFSLFQFPSQKNHTHLKDILFTTFLAISLSVTLIMIVFQNHTVRSDYEKNIYKEMQIYIDFIERQIIDNNGKIDTQLLQGNDLRYKHENHLILISNDEKKILTSSLPLEKTKAFISTGSKNILSNGLSIWMPERNGKPLMLWWNQAFYFIQRPLNPSANANILLLQSSKSLINKLQSDAIRAFSLLFSLLIACGAIAYLISNMLTRTILKLTSATKDIADKLQTGIQIEWPNSAISELAQLSHQTQLMSESINATFSDANKRSNAIIEASVDAIITINTKGIIESFNAAAEIMFGYSRKDMIGENISRLMPEPYQSMHGQYIKNFADEDRAPFSGNRREFSGLRNDNSVFPMELSLTKINLQNNILYTGIVSDISERKANEKLKKEFISTVSHELRTPLTSIQGAIKIIHARKNKASSTETQNMLDLADRNVDRLAELINDLLDFEKLDSDGIEYNLQSINPDDFLVTTIENDSPMAKNAGLTLVHSSNCSGTINADPMRLAQVLSNFISNATKFSPPGGNIHIGCRNENQKIKIYVEDHGPGIADEFKSRIFQRFSQADSSDTKQIQRGTGLGLAISKRMAEDMGGEVGFDSIEGQGSTFYITFPLQ